MWEDSWPPVRYRRRKVWVNLQGAVIQHLTSKFKIHQRDNRGVISPNMYQAVRWAYACWALVGIGVILVILDETALVDLPFFGGLFLFALPGGIFMLATIKRMSKELHNG